MGFTGTRFWIAGLLPIALIIGACDCGRPPANIAHCSDGVQSGDETGLDCGGSCPTLCPQALCDGEQCDAGCGSDGTCAAPTCSDGLKNGAETGTDCGGGTCPTCTTGGGCDSGADCESGVCTNGVCAAPSCTDDVKNGTETGTDCGGATCPACTTGGGCSGPTDCQSGVCTNGVCVAASCTDSVKNGTETGTDCGGGTCPACTTGGGCSAPTDCQSGVCLSGVCVAPSCTDSVKNGAETGTDCGGGTCPVCSTGGGCAAPTDCASGVCFNGVCSAPTCTDSVKNGTETGTDCGGGTCPACTTGGGCTAPADCASGVCTNGVCVAASCTDSVKNGSETGTDCGGGTCPACTTGGGCTAPADCASRVCLNGVCSAATCTDSVKNGAETGTDCGGGTCPACTSGSGCTAPADCQSGVCTNGVCVAPSCTDSVKNGSETGTDCGGGTCPACTTGGGCTAPADCASRVCTNGVCVAPSCTDSVKNGSETGTDCGGGTCPACTSGSGCTAPADCQSGVCANGVCVAPSCTDSVKNGSETGTDCGGGTCPACTTGGGCAAPADCASRVCTNGGCVAASCTDSVKNGAETGTDCGGGTCPACATGGGCSSNSDCASGVCTNGVCVAPTCTDSVKNGSETGTDCGGGSCPACGNGGTCSGRTDCASGYCSSSVCTACDDRSECLATEECVSGACGPDVTAPHVTSAFQTGTQTVRVIFSEPMRTDASAASIATAANYCIEVTDGDPSSCTATTDFTLTAVTVLDSKTVQLQLSAAPQNVGYTVVVSSVTDVTGNALGQPRHADFNGASRLQVVRAGAVDSNHIRVIFSKAVTATPDGAGSAGCTTAAECSKRYLISGPTNLGGVSAAVVQASPFDNEVVLTHPNPQNGANYVIVVANAVNGDGFDNAAFGSITRLGGGENVEPAPRDRGSFMGDGPPIAYFQNGPISVDPFVDGTPSGYVFGYRGKIHIGPNASGTSAVRANPDGSESEVLTFRFNKDTNAAGGSTSSNTSTAPFPAIGYTGCTANTAQCGPDNENGRGLFTSGFIGGTEWLIVGAGRSAGNLDYIYLSSDSDPTVDFKYVDLSNNTGGATRGFSAMAVFNGRAYLGFPDNGGKRPYFVSLQQAPGASAAGLDTTQNGNGGTACNPALHSSCYLAASDMPGIGVSGSPANSAGSQVIDFIAGFADRLYLGNNGGLVRSTNNSPLDYTNFPTHWTSTTPNAAAYLAKTSITTTKTAELDPADKAWPQVAVHNGQLYAARNTTTGPQLWRCDPTVVSSPAPATAADCDPGDWSLVAPNLSGDLQLTQFGNTNNAKLSLLVENNGYLYVGYDNAADGVVVFRSNAPLITGQTDFTGSGGCTAGATGCAGVGGNGFGTPSANTRFFDSVSLPFNGFAYVYVTVGNGTNPVRVYRHQN